MGLHSLDNWLLLLVFSMQLETYGLSCAVIEKVRRKRMTVVKKCFTCGWCNISFGYLKSCFCSFLSWCISNFLLSLIFLL